MHGLLLALLGFAAAALLFLGVGVAIYGVGFFGLGAQATLIVAVVLIVVALIAALLLYFAIKAQYRHVETGKEALIGSTGIVVTDLRPKGEVRVRGEFWQALSRSGEILSGQTVEVVGMEGMFLVVKPVEEKP